MSETELQAERLDRIAAEFADRFRRGERPAVSEYEQQYPDLAADLRELLPALVLMEQAASAADHPAPDDSAASASARSSASMPEQIGDFQIVREVGRGGMGIVYEAVEQSLNRRVALKLLPEQTMLSPHSCERFEREARAAARLHHSGIVPVFGLGQHDGLHYIAMQFIDGCGLDAVISAMREDTERPVDTGVASRIANALRSGSYQSHGVDGLSDEAAVDASPPMNADKVLKDSLAETVALRGEETKVESMPMPVRQPDKLYQNSISRLPGLDFWNSVASIGEQAARALHHAHRNGILHRDVKPSNLLLDLSGHVWLADFGLARADDQESLTNTGDILGTLRYMAPETFSGAPDTGSEIYALGLTLYELVTQRPAFEETNRNRLIQRVTSESPESLQRIRPDVPRDLRTIIEKAIRPEPQKRYATAAALADDLQRFLNDEPIHARRVTAAERLMRWSRKNRAVAASVAIVLAVLTVTSVGASLAAVSFEQLADAEQKLRQEADDARHAMEIVMADVSTSYGLLTVEDRSSPGNTAVARDPNHDAAEALLWFATAGQYGERDAHRRKSSQIRCANWYRELAVPVSALEHDGQRLDALEFDPSGRFLLTTGYGQMRVWDWQKNHPADWLDGSSTATDAVWSPKGRWLAVIRPALNEQDEPALEIISTDDGNVLHRETLAKPATSLAVSPDATRLAIATNSVRVLDCLSWMYLNGELKHPAAVHSMRFNQDGSQLVTASRDGKARVFAVSPPSENGDAATLADSPVISPIDHKPTVECAPVFVAAENSLVTVASPSELKWTPLNNESKPRWNTVRTGDSMLLGFSGSRDGSWFATGGYRSANVWDTHRKQQRRLRLPHRNHVAEVAFSSDGRFAVTAGWDARAKLWSLDGEHRIGQPLFHQGKVENAAFSPDGKFVATGQVDGLVRVWQLPDPEAERKDHVLPLSFSTMRSRLSRDGRFAVTTRFDPFGWGFRGTKCVVMDVPTGQPSGTAVELAGRELRDAALASDGELLAVASRAGDNGFSLSVQKTVTGESVCPPIALSADPQAIAFSPDDEQVAVYSGDGSVMLFSVSDARQLWAASHESLGGGTATRSVRFTPDGKTIVTTGPDFAAVWNADAGTLRFDPIQTGGRLKSEISPDGSLLALVAQGDGGLRVFDLQTGAPQCATIPHSDFVFELAFSKNGDLILTAGRDGQALLWDWRDGRRASPPLDHPDEVYDVALTPDGLFALTACRDGHVRIWELKTGKLIALPYRVRGQMATSVDVTPDGSRAVLGMNGTAMISLNLATRTTVSDRPLLEMQRVSELVSGQRIDNGNLTRLTTEEWMTRWRSR